MRIFRQTYFTALLLGASVVAHAGDIYRWVDERGQTHLSDQVPDKYKDSAKRIDSLQSELTPEQQREAAARVERDRARRAAVLEQPSEAASPQALPAVPESPPVIKRPVERVTESTDCTTWWRLFRESEECFLPFRNVGGGIKPEAFEHCNEIPSPELKCRPYGD